MSLRYSHSRGFRTDQTEQGTSLAPRLSRALPRYYGMLRPCSPHRYSHACLALSRFSLLMREQVPTFHTPAQTEVMPPLCRMPRGQYARSRHAPPRGSRPDPGFDIISDFDTCSAVGFRSSPLPAPFLDAHDRAFWTQPLKAGLASARASRRRGTFPHQGCSFRGTRTYSPN